MGSAPTGTAAQTPVVAGPARKEQPAALSRNERWLAFLVIAAGVVLVAVLLSAFMARTEAWSLKSKETTETTAATAQAGETTTTTVEYSDSVLITGLGLGALLVLTGAFYGRIREVTLPGGSGFKLGDLPAQKERQLEGAVEEKAEQASAEEGISADAQALAEEARRQARVVFEEEYWGVVPEPPEEQLDRIAAEAVERAKKVLG